VYVDKAYVDPLGIPRPRIEYHLDEYTKAGMATSRQLWTQLFRMLGTTDSTVYWRSDPAHFTYQGEPYTFHGAGHNVGTHRLGDVARDSVVDRDQRCWEHPNLYLVGCGSMPTIATSNPSLTMMALALRTLEAIEADLGNRAGGRI
jgi:choline dehydrogenase-like flavoprotein